MPQDEPPQQDPPDSTIVSRFVSSEIGWRIVVVGICEGMHRSYLLGVKPLPACHSRA